MDKEIKSSPKPNFWQIWQDDQRTNPNSVNPYAFVYGMQVYILDEDLNIKLDNGKKVVGIVTLAETKLIGFQD